MKVFSPLYEKVLEGYEAAGRIGRRKRSWQVLKQLRSYSSEVVFNMIADVRGKEKALHQAGLLK
ncbi:MAG: hypothetical protein IKR69_02330, partial [Bacteroidales bacterium]|nr:hypothetical protein [Bacteroidales bacterium]